MLKKRNVRNGFANFAKGSVLGLIVIAMGCVNNKNNNIEKDEFKLITIGASYWCAGGRGTIVAFLNAKNYKTEYGGGGRARPYMYYKERIAKYENKKSSDKNENYILLEEKRFENFKPNLILYQNSGVDGLLSNSSVNKKWRNFTMLNANVKYIDWLRSFVPNAQIVACSTWISIKNGCKKRASVNEIFDVYKNIEKEKNVLICPTVLAFFVVCNERPDIKLYRTTTDAHPSVRGQYLNCCMLFASITGETPVGLPSHVLGQSCPRTGEKMTLEPQTAKYLQEVAWRVYLTAIKEEKEIKLNPTQIIISKSKFLCKYNKSNQIISEANIERKINKEYKYENNKLKTIIEINSTNNDKIIKQFIYKDNLLVKTELYNEEGKFLGADCFEYDNKNKMKYYNLDKDKEVTESEKYSYKDNQLVYRRLFSAVGSQGGYATYKYNENGLLSEEGYNGENSKHSDTNATYIYNSNNTIKEIQYIIKNVLYKKVIFKYDNNKKIVSEKTYDMIDDKFILVKSIEYTNKYIK